jgi:diguanylate cyclase (GGDEF)-like protein
MQMKYPKGKFQLLFAVCVSYALILLVVSFKLNQNAIQEAESQLSKYLLSYSSVRQLIQIYHKPEVYRLVEKGFLYPEYFSPNLLSSTYSATSYIGLLNQKLIETGEPEVLFKLASDNPRNPANQADEYELNLLQSMRKGEIREFKELLQTGDGEIYFYAIPSQVNEERCLRCHGLPEDAPKEMIEIYGSTRGFYEDAGNLRALISMRLPMRTYYEKADRSFWLIASGLFVILLALYLVIAFLIHKIEKKNITISEQNRSLEKLSTTDPLTGLLNRYGTRSLAESFINVAIRHKEGLSLILMDIDHFKIINDQYGHAAGDYALREVAGILKRHQRTSDLVSRWGGEEFLVTLPKTTLDNSLLTAERIRLEIESYQFELAEQKLKVTASFGVASLLPDESLDDLIRRADNALYAAKRNGRNRVETDSGGR